MSTRPRFAGAPLGRRCAELAAEATNPCSKAAYLDLAKQWTKLATDIEMALALSQSHPAQK